MILHLLCGIPGSGKSTVAKNIPGYVVSTDAIRKFLWEDESVLKYDKLVFELAESIIRYMLSRKHDVIFDATNLKVKIRTQYIRLAGDLGAKTIVHWVDCGLETAIKRNQERDRHVPVPVIRAFYKSLQPPTISEGMDRIVIYREDLSVVEEKGSSVEGYR